MSITTSVIEKAIAIGDGRVSIVERHSSDDGRSYVINYIADEGADTNAALATHATQLLNVLAEQEATEVLND